MASVPVLVSTLTWCTPFVRRATVVSSPVCDLRSSRSGDYSQNTGRWSCGDRMLDRRPAPPIEGATNAARGGDDDGDGSRGGGGSKGGRSGKRSSAGRGRAKPGRAAVGRVLHKLRSLPDGASSSEIGLALGAARPSQLSARDYTTVLTTLRRWGDAGEIWGEIALCYTTTRLSSRHCAVRRLLFRRSAALAQSAWCEGGVSAALAGSA